MTTDYSKLTDREIDALVAERLMGWANVALYPALGTTSSYWSGIDPLVNDHRPVLHYSDDDNSARLVRNRIAELGLIEMYTACLFGLLNLALSGSAEMFWPALHATARQQCEAALHAMDAKVNQ